MIRSTLRLSRRAMSTASTNPANFANLPKDEVRAIASKGGKVSQERRHEELPGGGNPGNFANRPKDEVREIAAMGGRASGGFASMDPERQVGSAFSPILLCSAA